MAASASRPRAGAPELRPDSYWSKLALHTVPQRYLLGAALVSYIILGISYLQGVPSWLAFGLALIPWCLIMFIEIDFSYKHFGWFAVFFAMLFVQTIHYAEHCIEVVQVHIFGDPVAKSLAIFSTLNIESVHAAGDSLLSIGTCFLLWKFPRNKWLWIALPFQILHQAEHTFLWTEYILYGLKGGPGLLAHGGALFGGTTLNRPDLHWFYNTFYTIPFFVALVHQVRITYDEHLKEAFPDLPEGELIAVSKRLESFQYKTAETVLAPGDDVERLYIITEGEAGVYDHDENGRIVEIASLHAGQYFGDVGLLVPGAPHRRTIRAKTDLTVLAMDRRTFEHVMSVSRVTHDQMEELARVRMADAPAPEQPSGLSPA